MSTDTRELDTADCCLLFPAASKLGGLALDERGSVQRWLGQPDDSLEAHTLLCEKVTEACEEQLLLEDNLFVPEHLCHMLWKLLCPVACQDMLPRASLKGLALTRLYMSVEEGSIVQTIAFS